MKHWSHCSALILALSMGACSSDEIFTEEKSSSENAEIISIEATTIGFESDEINGRTIINIGESTAYQPVWAENDTIGIYPEKGDQLSFPIVDGVGTSTCVFNGGGWALKSSSIYTAYSPFNRAYYYKDNQSLPISMLGQKQIGNDNTEHLGKYDIQVAKGTTPTTGKISFAFKHQVCIVRLDIETLQANEWKSISLVSDAEITTEASLDLTSENPVLTPTATSNRFTLDLENVTTDAGENLTVYMMLLPVDFTGHSLNLSLVANDGTEYTMEAVIVNDYRNFGASKVRWITASVNSMEIHVETAGTLSTLVPAELKNTLTSLKLSGNLNGDDILFLREMLGKDVKDNYTDGRLEEVDMKKARIVEGGGQYYYNSSLVKGYFTSNDIIGTYMFWGLDNLKKITLPESTIAIHNNAFYSASNLEAVSKSNSIKSIGDNAFWGCKYLTGFDFEGVETIGESAFIGLTHAGLGEVYLPGTIKHISSYAFNGAHITSLTLGDGIESIGVEAFSGNEMKTLVIPNSVKTIDVGAFESCDLETITLPNNLKTIEDRTFLACTSLKTIDIPEGVTRIGEGAFYQCYSLTDVHLPEGLEIIDSQAFYMCVELTSINIPNSVKTIKDRVFTDCGKLQSLIIPSQVETIGEWTFSSTNLISAVLPNSVKTIGQCLFAHCKDLSSVVLSESLTYIPTHTFLSCTSLTEIDLPASVSSLAGNFINGCTALEAVHCNASTPPTVTSSFASSILQTVKLYVPQSSLSAYQNHEYWGAFTTIVGE